MALPALRIEARERIDREVDAVADDVSALREALRESRYREIREHVHACEMGRKLSVLRNMLVKYTNQMIDEMERLNNE